ncbi:helix-turn-helix domain-containing protein [Rhodococcus opacus]|nr:helix-turn-helix domain-containing protein [Rhodococcus opacus]
MPVGGLRPSKPLVRESRVGWPSAVTESRLAHAVQLRDGGATIPEIVTATGLTRSTLYRHLPPRLPGIVTAAVTGSDERGSTSTLSAVLREAGPARFSFCDADVVAHCSTIRGVPAGSTASLGGPGNVLRTG